MADGTVKINPYLAFPSTAEESLKFYQSVFGGELTLMRFGDMPNARPDNKDLIMHGMLDADDITIMASDGMKDADVKHGTSVSISLSGTDEARLKEYFEKLSEGGTVIEKLMKAPWGDQFGMLTDKLGFSWMINITAPENAK